jgi:glucose/arabinose dehydrogenase/regulation of enolase protein 1 (concanavalin A-like superfamily)
MGRARRNLIVLFIVPALIGLTGCGPRPPDVDRTLVVGGLDAPTAFRFLPDGRVLIAEKAGTIQMLDGGTLHPVVTIPVDGDEERGLLGLEPAPDFGTTGHLYVSYTTTANHDRLSRFTVTGDTIDLASEVVLLESTQAGNVFHHGGEVRFGPDGKLYWAMGINTFSPNAQDLTNVHGKLLRMNPDGSAPPDNPFVDTPGAIPQIWAYGLRNPFRFDFLPDGQPIVSDVGGSHWEEVDVVQRGGNYGWPEAEGVCDGCPYINPLFAYPHTDPPASAGSNTSALWYSGTALPEKYQNSFFYADYTLHFIRYLKLSSDFSSVLSDNAFDTDAGTPVQLSQAPDGSIWQLNIYPGELYRWSASGGNQAPVASASASPTDGLAPLAVTFSSAGSHDPEGQSLSYAWDFGDGSTSTSASPSHTYTANGSYAAKLTVSDGTKTSSATVSVVVGNRRPTVTITAPSGGGHYDAGDTIDYRAVATDPEDGALGDAAFSWKVVFHHADHVHPYLGPVAGSAAGSFSIAPVPDNGPTTWFEIQATATDSGGLSATTSVEIYPNLVNLTVQSTSAVPVFTVDGMPKTGSYTTSAVVGVEHALGAPSPQQIGSTLFLFSSWSDGGAQNHTITVPATDRTYTVDYTSHPPLPAPWSDTDIGAPSASGYAYQSGPGDGTYTVAGAGNDVWAGTDQLHYAYQPLPVNGRITARLVSQLDTDPWAKAGVMIKQSAVAGAPYSFLAVTPGHGVHHQYNFTGDQGGVASADLPLWLRLTRHDSSVTAETSADGVSWTSVGTASVPLTGTVTAGLAVSAHATAVRSIVTFDDVTVEQLPDTPPPPGPLPPPWVGEDVGAPAVAGSSGYTSSSDVFTITGAGNDVWADADQFQFVHQSLAGDGVLTARLLTQSPTDPWAKAGLMIKQSTVAGSPYAFLAVTPGHGVHLQHDFTGDQSGPAVAVPVWLRLTRTGSTVLAETSPDGTTWTAAGTVTLSFTGAAQLGLGVTSHNGPTPSTATFDHVSFSVP